MITVLYNPIGLFLNSQPQIIFTVSINTYDLIYTLYDQLGSFVLF